MSKLWSRGYIVQVLGLGFTVQGLEVNSVWLYLRLEVRAPNMGPSAFGEDSKAPSGYIWGI